MHRCKGFLIIHVSTFLNNFLFFKNKNILSKKVGKKVEKVEKWIFFQKKWKKSEKWKKVEKSKWAGESGGRAELWFHQRIADICRNFEPGFDTPRAPMGAADLRTLRGSRRAVMNPSHM